MKILFVCTGNTCRSPMAEGLFRQMLLADPMGQEIMCQSAGLSANAGDLPSENAVKAMETQGIDITEHRARRLSAQEIPMWDVYFTMSKTHGYILEKGGVPPDRIYVPSYIEDPFGGDLATYCACREKLQEQLTVFLGQMRVELNRRKTLEAQL